MVDGPKVTPHDARRACASELADLGLSSSYVAAILGHSTSGITEAIYSVYEWLRSQSTSVVAWCG